VRSEEGFGILPKPLLFFRGVAFFEKMRYDKIEENRLEDER
jgi:hypothetical protein